MYFKAAILFSLAASAIALPTSVDAPKKRAGVLTTQNYADFQVSDGVAGNALAEVQAKFPVSDPAPSHLAVPTSYTFKSPPPGPLPNFSLPILETNALPPPPG